MTDDDRIRAALVEVDGIARDVDHYEYGLPLYDGHYERMAAAVRTAFPPPLTWTADRPTRPGWYFLRLRAAPPRMREVVETAAGLAVEAGWGSLWPLSTHYLGYSWAGPVPEPQEATA